MASSINLSSASLNGYEIEVTFSLEVPDSATLQNLATYTFNVLLGGGSTLTDVRVGTEGSVGFVESLIFTHTGTMLGGNYQIVFDNAFASLLGLSTDFVDTHTKGEAPELEILSAEDDLIVLEFSESILPESEWSDGAEKVESYVFTPTDPYPVDLTATLATQTDSDNIELQVKGMTNVEYTLLVTDSESLDYQGTELPSENTTFTGTELGIGTSSASTYLSMTKSSGATYGWRFEDSSGKVTATTSSYRMDITFDVRNSSLSPAVGDIFTLKISDGNVEIPVTFAKGSPNTVAYGGVTSVNFDWESEIVTLTVLRNIKADSYVFLLNGEPSLTTPIASFSDATTFTGVEMLFDSATDILNFHLNSILVHASNTVYSQAWNMLFGVGATFTGSSQLTKSSLLTQRGPLVKGWGDATLATKQDVTVTINGTEVEVSEVNPFIGEVTLAIPIPLMPLGEITVEVDYIWFPTPLLEMGGLNTLGSVLNKYDLSAERGDVVGSSLEIGAVDTSRFPMALVLPFLERRDPLHIGHRYIGFEQAYTASLNSPTTLLLNQNPHGIAVDKFETKFEEIVDTYEGTESPSWDLLGTDNGSLEVGEETYNVDGEQALYNKQEDLTFDSVVNLVGRFQTLSYTLNGVSTGVGFGFHDNYQFYFIGALVVNGVEHIALLKDNHRLDEESSWEFAFQVDGEIVDTNKVKFTTLELPLGLEVGNRFQFLSGTQKGVYTISEVIRDTRFKTTTLVLEETFPEDYTLFGNTYFTAVFEIKHTERNTYRLVSEPKERSVELYVSGEISGFGLIVPEVILVEPVNFGLDAKEQGQIVWGNLDPNATCSSSWSFFRYSVTPAQNKEVSFGHRIFTELETLPQENPNSEWFLEDKLGFANIESGTLLLSSVDDGYNFTRIEPFLTNQADLDVAIKVKNEFFTSGADTFVEIWDATKIMELAFIAYLEPNPLFSDYRRLVEIPYVTKTSRDLPYKREDGFSLLTDSLVLVSPSLVTGSLEFTDSTERKAEIKFAVTSNSFDGGGLADFQVDLSLLKYDLYIYFKDNEVLCGGDLSSVSSAFDWEDQEQHTYKIVYSSGNVSFLIDNVVQFSVAVGTLASAVADQEEKISYSQSGASTVWDYMTLHIIPPSEVKKTLGVRKGADRSNIDSWELPRTDSSPNPNSYPDGVVIQEIAWDTTYQEIRIHRDITWGVTILIDNLAPPPYFDGDWFSDITIPSAGWINVEYPQLPRHKLNRKFGFIKFGSNSVSQQLIDWMRYRLYNHPIEDYRSPQNMVLNQYNVIHSGETTQDTTPEVLEILSLDKNHVLLTVTDYISDFVYKVLVDNAILSEDVWSFDQNSQVITLDDGILSSEHYPVTVVCRVNKTPTITYLESQPLLDSTTLLNENTPSFAKSRLLDTLREVAVGEPMTTTESSDVDITHGISTDDSLDVVVFNNEADDLYESMTFIEVTNEGDQDLIKSICDSNFPEHGLREIVLSGTLFTEDVRSVLPPQPPSPHNWGANYFFLGGGTRQTNGLLNDPSYMIYPTANNKLEQETFMVLELRQISIAEGIHVDLDLTVPTPSELEVPTAHADSVTAPSTTTTNGGVFLTMQLASEYSRIGPWGGIDSLEATNQQALIGGVNIGTPLSTRSILDNSFLHNGFILQGGAPLPLPSEYSTTIEPA